MKTKHTLLIAAAIFLGLSAAVSAQTAVGYYTRYREQAAASVPTPPTSAWQNCFVNSSDHAFYCKNSAGSSTAISGLTLTAQHQFTKDQGSNSAALTDGSTVSVDCSLGNAFTLTLTASGHTLGNPSNCLDGHTYQFFIKQAAGGGDALSFDTKYAFSAGTAPTITTTASKTDIVSCTYLSTPDKLYCVWVGNF